MTYNNAYNKDIAQQVRFLSQNHVNREKEVNDFATTRHVGRRQASAKAGEDYRGGRGPVCGRRFGSGGFGCWCFG
ncbi:MAG: hypothetical protein ACKPKO_29435, partial [Candidatus Fonsibacter sp.]